MYKEEKHFFAQMYNHFGYSPGGYFHNGTFFINGKNIPNKELLDSFMKRTDFLGDINKIEVLND